MQWHVGCCVMGLSYQGATAGAASFEGFFPPLLVGIIEKENL